tara:strand:+ start:5987 stop:6955 length:969 start_codon:yes stop_codon:yes gene_type:complete
MTESTKEININEPRNQLKLFGYNDFFNKFISIYKKRKLPSTILLSGPKGIGKATFAYHFINYLLSMNDVNKYSLDEFEINPENLTYKLITGNTHPNFFSLDNTLSENIKISQVRDLLKFLSQSTYSNNLKIVLIDNAEHLNLHSSNALLKAIEEPFDNTFFFIIHNDTSKLLDTIKSRAVQFKINFSISEKKDIFQKIVTEYLINYDKKILDDFLYFDTPGNFLQILSILNASELNLIIDDLESIFYLMEKFKASKNNYLLSFINLLIERYYNKLSITDNNNINQYFIKKSKIQYMINDMKKFNLDKKNLLISIDRILKSAN